jgi:CDP-paratose 2-epimerase
MLEAIDRFEKAIGRTLDWTYVDDNRVGDHMCYISDLRRIQNDYPDWELTRSLDSIIQEIAEAAVNR